MVKLSQPTREREKNHESLTLHFIVWTRWPAYGLPDARRDGLSRIFRASLRNASCGPRRNACLQHIAGVLRDARLGLFYDDGLRWLPSRIRRSASPTPQRTAASGTSGRTWGVWWPWRAYGAAPSHRWSATSPSLIPPFCCTETVARKGFVREGFPMEGRYGWKGRHIWKG